MRVLLVLCLSVILLCVTIPNDTSANEFGVNIYGLSYHVLKDNQSRDRLNEFNPGMGFRATFGGHKSSHFFFEGGRYKDSFENTAKYLSIGFLLRILGQLRVGVNAAVYTSRSIRRGDAFFAPIPIASFTLGPVTANGVYLPEHKGINPYRILGFYLTIRLFEGSPGKNK